MSWFWRFGWRKAELQEEIDAHLQMAIADRVGRGESEQAARQAALRELGNVPLIEDVTRRTWGWLWLEKLLQDLSYAGRILRKSPGFTAVVVLILALGIGANTAIFTLVDTVLLRPLPYRDASRLVWATEHFPSDAGAAKVLSPDFMAWKDNNHVFEQVGASSPGAGGDSNLTGAGQAVQVSVRNVTTNYFPMLGVRPFLGRIFLASEGKLGSDHVALLSESLWRNQFGSDPRLLGRTIHLDGSGYTVVGVMPASLRYPSADVWTPFALNVEMFSPHSTRWANLEVVGRLKPGIGIIEAQSNLQVITEQVGKEIPTQASQDWANVRVEVIPLQEMLAQHVRSLLLILMGAVGLVLVIACLNVANLLLSRSVARGKEMSVRTALGAQRSWLVRQLLTEGLLLAAAGGIFGYLVGLLTTKIVAQLIPSNFPTAIHLDLRVFAFTVSVALFAVLTFGLVPALTASRTDVSQALNERHLGARSTRSTHNLRAVIATGEVALALILLIATGLVVRSFLSLADVSLGFDPHGLLIGTAQRPWSSNEHASEAYAAFFQTTLTRVRHLPGVVDAALVSQYPFKTPYDETTLLDVLGRGKIDLPEEARCTSTSPDYFRVMRIRLLKGRVFSGEDAEGAQPVAIVNESLARTLFHERDPLGQHISFNTPRKSWMEVVGVVSDTRNGTIEDEPGPELFMPYLQQPTSFMTYVVRTGLNPDSLAGALREAVQDVDQNQPVFGVRAMDEVIANQLAPRKFSTLLLGLFALLALVLVVVGIFGVISYSVAQRTHEIGIRMALGAQREDVSRMVVAQGFRLTLIGVAVGIAGALALTRMLSSLLYSVKPTDPLTFIGVTLIMTAAALLASYIPARRATKVNPIIALRCN
jgi:predicted permease